MMKIYKYPLGGKVSTVPTGEVIHIGEQEAGSILYAWILVDPDRMGGNEPIELYVFGTGQDVPTRNVEHVGTAVMSDGYVWHVFKKRTT